MIVVKYIANVQGKNMIDFDKVIKYSKDLKLLYVEDNPEAREMTLMLLEDFFQDITIAVNGEDGLQKFKENDIDLILTDINMPKLNGLEMSQKIRELDRDIPIIILSAHNEEDFFIDSIRIGVSGYILKPIDIDQLASVIYNISKEFKYKKEAKESLNLLKAYQKAIDNIAIVSKTDPKGIITYANDIFCKISGYTKEELIGKPHNIIRHPDNPKSIFKKMWHTIKDEKKIWRGIVRNRAKNGKSYYADALVMPILNLNGDIIEYIAIRHEITDIMNPYRQLKDEINSASNPLLLYFRIDNYEDLEGFYEDNILEELNNSVESYLSSKLSKKFRYDKLYNLDKGKFALILDFAEFDKNINIVIDSLQKTCKKVKDIEIQLNLLKINISFLVALSSDKEDIIKDVELGVKELKKSSENLIVATGFTKKEKDKFKKNIKTIFSIRNALANSRIVSYFQPIIDNKTKKIVKYESLVRLIDEKGKVLSPFFFLEVAKRSNYYIDITNIILKHSMNILQNSNFEVSINLSALDIEHSLMRETIIKLIKECKNCSRRLIFELLEDEAIKDFRVVEDFIKELKEYGVKIAIDDFGTGYSNYERLLQYQPDILKIDGSLIRDIETSEYSLSVVKSIVTFAKEQKLQTVAEFIENENIYKIIKELGVDFSQGYFFGKPEPMEKICKK